MADKNVQVRISATDDVSTVLGKIQGQLKSFGQTVSGIFSGLGVAVGAAALGSFFKASIDQATQADHAYRLLALSLDNLGVNAAAVRPEIDTAVKSLARLTGQDDSTIVGGLTRLIGITGDYQKSLKLLPLALDVAAARGLDLGVAVDLVGKTANGSVTALNKLGFAVKSAADGIPLLEERFGGAAAAMASPLDRLIKTWNQVKEAMGRALLGGDALGSGIDPLINALKSLEQWITANQDEVSGLATGFVQLVADVMPVVMWIGTKLIEAFKGAEMVGIDLARRFANIGPTINYAYAVAVRALAQFLADQADLFDSVFGTHIAAAMDKVIVGAQKMQHAAAYERSLNNQAATDAINGLFDNGAASDAPDAGVSAKGRAAAKRIADQQAAAARAEAIKSLEDEATLAEKLTTFTETRVKGLTQLAMLEGQINALLKSRNLSDKDRLALLTAQEAVLKAQAKAGEVAPLVGQTRTVQRVGPHGEPLTLVESGGTAHERPTITARQSLGPTPGLREITPEGPDAGGSLLKAQFESGLGQSAEFVKGMDEARKSVDSVGDSLGRVAGSALAGFTSAWEDSVNAVVDGSKSMGQAIADAITGAVAAGAKAEGERYLWLAVGDLGDAFLGHPGAFAAAAKHLAAGTGLLVLAATLGGGGGGGGGASAGGGAAGGATASQPQNQTYTINTGAQNDVRGLAKPGVPSASAGALSAALPSSWVASASSPSAAIVRGLAVLGGAVGNGGRLSAAGGSSGAGVLSAARMASAGPAAGAGPLVVQLPSGAVLRADAPELQELIGKVFAAGRTRGLIEFQVGGG